MTMRSWQDPFKNRGRLGLLCAGCALSLALLATPLAGRWWLLLAWTGLVYMGSALVPALRTPSTSVIQQVAKQLPARYAEPLKWEVFYKPTEEALRKLDDPASLGGCALAELLPRTMQRLTERDESATHLSRHQALRRILEEAVDRLRPAEGAEIGKQTLQYSILHDEYVLGRKTAYIMTRHSISEANLHLHRRNGIRAVASDLAEQEQALSQHRL